MIDIRSCGLYCKQYETIYGTHLKSVETPLKDLFRTCHELQLTYLMTLEKHFIFDLSEKEEQDILIEALNINMRIGDVVQVLDIKTMAEQWKAYAAICEKYSSFLLDKNIINKCSQMFSTIIMDNIKKAIESKDDKTLLRSLKVANFTIKILSRISNVFKHAVANNYQYIVELVKYIYIYNPQNLQVSAQKSAVFINLMLVNVLNPTDSLCRILLQDERFLDYIYKIDPKNLETDALLGYIILIITIIKAVTHKKEDQVMNGKQKLVDCVYRILPLGHYWFNMGLRFRVKIVSGTEIYFSLYEYLLTHTIALAMILNTQQYCLLEKYMYESLLGTECYSAMFSSNLWVLLMRLSKGHLPSNTLSALLNVYQKLEKHSSFYNSPQQAHLSYTIGKLFEVSTNDTKRLIWKKIQQQNTLWSVFRVSSFRYAVRRVVENGVLNILTLRCQKLIEVQDLSLKEVEDLTRIVKIASTCTFAESCEPLQEYLVKTWAKVCYKSAYIHPEYLFTSDTVWYYKFLEALISLTETVRPQLNSEGLKKIIHTLSTLLQYDKTEITVLLYDSFCKLTFSCPNDANKSTIDSIFKDVSKILLKNEDICTKRYVRNILSEYENNEHFKEICDEELQIKKWNNNMRSKDNSDDFKQEMLSVGRVEYTHKCLKITAEVIEENSKQVDRNTALMLNKGDFSSDDDHEGPSKKKAKLEGKEAAALVGSLENDALILCQVPNEDIDSYKSRIKEVIDKLSNIVT